MLRHSRKSVVLQITKLNVWKTTKNSCHTGEACPLFYSTVPSSGCLPECATTQLPYTKQDGWIFANYPIRTKHIKGPPPKQTVPPKKQTFQTKSTKQNVKTLKGATRSQRTITEITMFNNNDDLISSFWKEFDLLYDLRSFHLYYLSIYRVHSFLIKESFEGFALNYYSGCKYHSYLIVFCHFVW